MYHLIILLFVTLTCQQVVPQFLSQGRLTGTSFGIPNRNATYDYVIVGGGLAGLVVAARLTQETNYSVAVIEAGSFYELSNGNWSQIPYWSEQWVGAEEDEWQPLVDWGLFTTPQENGESIHYAQGKALGGSSTRNQMIYHRPTIGSYQAWADRVGDQNYTWENMLPYFQKSMTFSSNQEARASNATANYSLSAFPRSGPLHVSFPAYAQPLSSYGPEAFSSIGIKASQAFSSGSLDGYGYHHFTIDSSSGTRSSAQTFLDQAIGRPNLKVYVNAMARNIIVENKTAVGVNVTVNGVLPFTLSANREVIVSAGAYHSPQLLMVSGIGPRATLEKFEIPVVSALEGVGQNMWDSCSVGGPIYPIDVLGQAVWQRPEMMQEAVDSFLANGTGPLTNPGYDFVAWEKLSNLSASARAALSSFPDDWPEVEYLISSNSSLSNQMNEHYGSIRATLVAAMSRGNMTIQSASNMVPPVINPNWLRDETDQEVAVQAYRRARQAWQAMGTRAGDEVFPGANVTSDADLLAAIKKQIAPVHHASSSCAMGRVNDTMAVVDSHAKVIGVHNLRVIDSSSFPFTPPGHTQGTTYAHAEKLTDDVLAGR